jgi:hypothetical protein
MNKILSLFESFRKPDPQGEPIDLTYGKLRVNRTVSHGGPALSFNETSVAVHRAIYESLGITPKV